MRLTRAKAKLRSSLESYVNPQQGKKMPHWLWRRLCKNILDTGVFELLIPLFCLLLVK
jgi:hypothetical protein